MKPSDKRRFEELLDTALDYTATDAQRRELSEIISQHTELAGELVEQLDMHSLLEWQCKEVEGLRPLRAAVLDNTNSYSASLPAKTHSAWSRHRWLLATSAAILLAAGSALGWHFMRGDGEPEIAAIPKAVVTDDGIAVAEIVDENLVIWSEKNTALQGAKTVIPGRLEMISGTLKLRFRSGATVTMSGSTSMQVVSGMLLRLDNGQATAHVPQWAKGFTIETGDCEVIDLGTQFGVVARKGELTDVVVFEGEVDLKSLSRGKPNQRRLTAGEGLRVTRQGNIDRIVGIQRDPRGDLWSVDEPIARNATISSIHDNIEPADSSKYYQITPGALADDARAYVDRPHQWNGLSGEGLPDFLQRADYVRTFNDYKYLNQLEIVVELAQPADVYLFFDDRVTAPQWLVEQFKDTGVDVGLDEGPWPPEAPTQPELTIAVGAGASVDNVFSVWHRRCERTDTLILGAMGDSLGARAIYGIAATPLK